MDMDFTKDIHQLSVLSMPVILRSTPAYGDIIAFQITAAGGVTLSDKPGAIELLTKTLHSGTPSYSKEDIDRIFTESGAVYSIEPRSDYIDVSLKCLKKFLPKLLPVIAEMLEKPLLTEQEVELSRSQQIADLKNELDHPDSVLQLISQKAFFRHHPYLNRASGYLDTVPGIKRSDLVELLPRIFNRGNLLFTMIGDLNQKEAEDLVKKYFSGLPEGKKASFVTQAPSNDTSEVHFKKFDAPTTYFIAKFKASNIKAEDYPSLVLAAQILDLRLFEEVRTKRGLTYAVSAAIGNSGVNSGYLYVSSTKLPEAVKIIFHEVHRIQEELIDPETLELQVRKFTSSWYLGREQSSSQARILSLYEMIGPGWRESSSFITRLDRATPESVRAAARKYFQHYTVAVVGPEKPKIEEFIPGLHHSKPESLDAHLQKKK